MATLQDKTKKRPDDSHHQRLLRGAVAEYLDEGLIEDFMEDMGYILSSEIAHFEEQAGYYKSVRDQLFPPEPANSPIPVYT